MIQVDSITFTDQGVVITYLDREDIRVDGKVVVAHQISLHHSHPDYRADAEELADLARKVVRNALEDWAESPSFREETDTDDDRGMGE